MRRILASVLLACVGNPAGFAQSTPDVPPNGPAAIRAADSEMNALVTIETTVALDALIKRLNKNWKLVETGRAYWIGYTDDMFSIASHGDQAVEPLVEFIRGSSSQHAREGALLTLHLIGIRSRVAGRFYEEFESKVIRNAFYTFLDDRRLREQVLRLLVRDPWPSDVARIMELLAKQGDTNCRATVNALFRYSLPCPSFGGLLAADAKQAHVFTVEGAQVVEIGEMDIFRDSGDDQEITQLHVTDKDTILQWVDGGFRKSLRAWKFKDLIAARKHFAAFSQGHNLVEVTYNAIRKDDFVFRYCWLSDPFNFQVAGESVYIIDASAARERWLTWWRKLSNDDKKKLMGLGARRIPQ